MKTVWEGVQGMIAETGLLAAAAIYYGLPGFLIAFFALWCLNLKD